MELNVIGAKPLSVSDAVFGKEFRQDLVHQVVTAYRNAGRAGTKAQLTRSEVSGTTKKFKKQKGGGARHGDYRAPIFVGGGVAFAAKPRDFSQKVNKKMSGQMGNVTRSAMGLEVVQIDTERNLIAIKGAVPGATGGDVIIRAGGANLFANSTAIPYYRAEPMKTGEVHESVGSLRMRRCLGPDCNTMFGICRCCDRGQR